MKEAEDIVGRKIKRLTVLEKTDQRRSGKILYKCVCDCQLNKDEADRQYVYVTKNTLMAAARNKKGGTGSCGCLARETKIKNGKNNKRTNKYIIHNDYVEGWTQKGYRFLFDKEDYELISKYCWHRHQDGYLRTCCDYYFDDNGKRHNKYIMMHQLLIKENYSKGEEIDHINGKPYDNRKCNLRLTDHNNNMKNSKIPSNNKSGIKGVCYSKIERKWKSYIYVNKKRIHLGTYINKEDAIKARKDAEKIYFGDFLRKGI